MAKELNEYQVRLTFDANTEKAKKQLKDLQQQLQSLATGSGSDKLNFSDEIAKASKAAAELSAHLSQATNMKTGTLDFTKLNDSIKKSGQSLANYGEQLLKLGPSGQQAFQKLATAVSNSEIPVRRISNTLREMGTVLKNTIKWQISSSAIHSFMGAVQSAYGYAQDLNESLNNIRIVTGQNIEQMERFAATANKAAKALSASTLDYTDAALIYYQQGLSDEEVKARTDVTVKMANVTGDSAEKVSQQLTAVWNNFAKGADNLEYFADVMTALGAATASSSDEISSGLEKFASVGETVGLSYEYAASALATITATTRQSAEVVGNALKTIFARLEGLKLGETLEDETDLNKYSQALHNVGVEIKDASGNLRSMDDILDDTAAKWQTLSKDQQMALAQTVAGVRQYTQFVALMNNWDFMQDNVEIAKNSTGELQKQQKTYTEGWEAAQKRVKAAAEGIYQSLIDDDFFITMLNGAEHVLETVNSLIKSLGGIPGVLALIGNVFSRVFEKQMIQGLQNTAYNLQTLTASGRAKVAQEKQNAQNAMLGLMPTIHMTDQDFGAHAEDNTRTSVMREINELQLTLNKNADKYNEIQLMTNQSLLEQKKIQGEKVVATGVQRDKVSVEAGAGISEYMTRIRDLGFGKNKQYLFDSRGSRVQDEILQSTFFEKFQQDFKKAQQSGTAFNQVIEKTKRILNKFSDQFDALNYFADLNDALNKGTITAEEYEQTLEQLIQSAKKYTQENSEKMVKAVNNSTNQGLSPEEAAVQSAANEDDFTENFVGNAERRAEAIRDNVFANDDFHESNERMKEDFNVVSQNYATWSTNLAQGAQAVMGLASSLTMITGIMDSLWDGIANGTLTVKDVIANITTIGMLIPTILTGLNGLKSIEEGLRLTREAKNLATEKDITLAQAKHILDLRAAGDAGEKEAAFLKDIAAQKAATAETAKNTPVAAANAGVWAAHPLIIMAGIIMAVVLAVSVLNKVQEENTKKLKENAEEAQKVADEHQKIIDEHNELAKSFYNQISLYKESGEVTDELIDSTIKLADAYDIENARLKILQGRYKEVIKAIREKQIAELQEQKQKRKEEQNAQLEYLVDKTKNFVGVQNTTLLSALVHPYGRGSTPTTMAKLLNEAKQGEQSDLITTELDGGLRSNEVNFDPKDTQSFLQSYEFVKSLVEQAEKSGQIDESVKTAQATLKDFEEIYSNLKQMKDQEKDINVTSSILGHLINTDDITNAKQFHELSEKIVADLEKQGIESKEAKKKVQSYFLDDSMFKQFAANEELIGSAAKDAQQEFNYVLDFYNNLSDEEKAVFFTIKFDEKQTKEEWQKELDYLTTLGQSEQAETKLDTASGAYKKLKRNMTEEDYRKFKDESGIEWGQNDIIEYSEFLALSFKEQKRYLENIIKIYRKDLLPAIQKETEEKEKHIEELEAERDKLNETARLYGHNAILFDEMGAAQEAASMREMQADALQKANELEQTIETEQNEVDELNKKYDETTIRLQKVNYEAIKTFENLKWGDVVEDLQDLPKIAREFFTEMEDGTYKLTGAVDQLKAVLFQAKTQPWVDQLTELSQKQNNITTIKEYSTAMEAPEVPGGLTLGTVTVNQVGLTEKEVEQQQEAAYNYALAADSLTQLNIVQEKFNELQVPAEIQSYAISAALEDLATKYTTCSDELQKFQFALTTSNEDLIEATRNTLEYSIHTAELAEKMGLSVGDIEDQARAFKEEKGGIKDLISDEQELTKVSTTMASLNQSMNKGVTALTKNWDTWKKTLSTSEKTSMDYVDAIQELRTVLKDLTGVLDEDFIPKDFFDAPEVMELMDKAAQGDAKSINLLGTALAKSSIEAKEFKAGMEMAQAAIMSGVSMDDFDPFASGQERFDYYKNNVLEGIENLNQAILNGTVQAGKEISDLMDGTGASWVESLNAMAVATGMSVDEMKSLLNSLGVEAEVQSDIKKVHQRVPRYITRTETLKTDDTTGRITETATSTFQDGFDEFDGYMEVAQINMGAENKGKKPTIHYAGRSTPSTASTTPSGSKGGGGKSSQKPKSKNEVERYHEIKSTIKDLTTEYERLEKAEGRAFGEGKLHYIADEITKTEQLIDANKEYIRQIKNWQSIDIERANQVAKQFGFEEFDDQTNWTDIQYKLIDYYNANILNSEDEKLKEGYETWVKYIEQVIETHQLLNDTIDEGTELITRTQDLTFKDYTTRIELRVELQDKSKQVIESKLNALGDSFYKKVEAAYLLLEKMDINYDETRGLSLTGVQQNFDQLEDDMVYAKNLFDQGKISADQAHDAFNTVFDSALATANDLASLNDDFKTYYREALDQAKEDIAWLEKGFSNITDQLDHYKKLIDLTGQTKAYDKQLVILRTQLSVAEDQLEVHKDQAKTAKADYERMLEFYNSLDDAGKAQYEDQLRAQKDYLDELDAAVREDTEHIAEYAQEILTTSLEQIYDAYEKSLTNGAGFDYLNQIMDLAAEKADLVLTKTNQIYETNKMIHNLDRDIEKTNNQYAKTRLSNFKSEIEELREKGELTHYELEDAQLRYEVLKAQIALEEAQNAKSTVRLQRDNEGNFGYVFTADRENIAQAQDNLEKALNDRYNHALEAQEDFQRQYYNTEKEFEDALRALNEQRMSGEISEETYQKRVLEIKNYYLPILSTLEENNLAALEDMNETSTEHINDSWTRMFNENGYGLKGKTKEWEDSTITAVGSVSEAFQEWQKTIDKDIEPEVTTDLGTLTKKTQDLKTESENLRIEISEKFHSIVKPLLDDINDITSAWADQETQIQNLITKYQNLATAATENIQKVNDAQRATYTAYASDGSTYTIHSEKGVHFIESSKKGDTLQGGDQSSWVNLGNGAVKITTKNGKEYLYGSIPSSAEKTEPTTNFTPKTSTGTNSTTSPPTTESGRGSVPTRETTPPSDTTTQSYKLIYGNKGDASTSTAYFSSKSAAEDRMALFDPSTMNATLYQLIGGKWQKIRDLSQDFSLRGSNSSAQGSLKYATMVSAATGGYTGSWGPEGKVAMLHEKELVLNADDTRNFLAGVSILRDITQAIDLQAVAAAAAPAIAMPGVSIPSSSLDQHVTIAAEFPNVTNHLEIEEAFNNLVNRASQYANRF